MDPRPNQHQLHRRKLHILRFSLRPKLSHFAASPLSLTPALPGCLGRSIYVIRQTRKQSLLYRFQRFLSRKTGDPYRIRTDVNGVRGRCLNHLTNGPHRHKLHIPRFSLRPKRSYFAASPFQITNAFLRRNLSRITPKLVVCRHDTPRL